MEIKPSMSSRQLLERKDEEAMQERTGKVSSRPMLGVKRIGQTKRVSNKRGATAVAPSVCAPAFLTSQIDYIKPSNDNASSRFGIDIDRSYRNILACCKRFLKFVGVKFDFIPTDGSKSYQLGELIEYFENKLDQFGVSLCVTKKTPYGEELEVLECVIYRHGRELDDIIIVLYVSPAMYLSEGTSALYKRFIKFFSDSTNIPLGIKDSGDNFYLEMIAYCYEDYDDDEDSSNNDNVISKYKECGEFWNLFDEISSLPQESEESILSDLEKYRPECPADEFALLDSMIMGVPIVKDANYYWFEFNPENDGLPDEYGNTDNEGWASSVFASAILYSENDGVGEQLIDTVNNDVQSGIMMYGWNIHQWISPKTKKEDIDEFMRCKDLVASLDKWVNVFSQEASKFDKYGKSE